MRRVRAFVVLCLALLASGALAPSAWGDPGPVATTGDAAPVDTGDGFAHVELHGTVNAAAASFTRMRFEVGETTAYGMNADTSPPYVSAGSGDAAVTGEVSYRSPKDSESNSSGEPAPRILPGHVYHYRLAATDSGGHTGYGADRTFTAPGATTPLVTTDPVQYVPREQAAPYTLEGTISPRGNLGSYYFEYGRTQAYGTKSGVKTFGPVGGDTHAEDNLLADTRKLGSGATYHYRLVATGEDFGTVYGADRTFTVAQVASPLHITVFEIATDPLLHGVRLDAHRRLRVYVGCSKAGCHGSARVTLLGSPLGAPRSRSIRFRSSPRTSFHFKKPGTKLIRMRLSSRQVRLVKSHRFTAVGFSVRYSDSHGHRAGLATDGEHCTRSIPCTR